MKRFIAFALPTMTRQERVKTHRSLIFDHYSDSKLTEFLDFVLDHYVEQGVGELAADNLPDLLKLKYDAISDATRTLGEIQGIRETFTGFQKHLYEQGVA